MLLDAFFFKLIDNGACAFYLIFLVDSKIHIFNCHRTGRKASLCGENKRLCASAKKQMQRAIWYREQGPGRDSDPYLT